MGMSRKRTFIEPVIDRVNYDKQVQTDYENNETEKKNLLPIKRSRQRNWWQLYDKAREKKGYRVHILFLEWIFGKELTLLCRNV